MDLKLEEMDLKQLSGNTLIIARDQGTLIRDILKEKSFGSAISIYDKGNAFLLPPVFRHESVDIIKKCMNKIHDDLCIGIDVTQDRPKELRRTQEFINLIYNGRHANIFTLMINFIIYDEITQKMKYDPLQPQFRHNTSYLIINPSTLNDAVLHKIYKCYKERLIHIHLDVFMEIMKLKDTAIVFNARDSNIRFIKVN